MCKVAALSYVEVETCCRGMLGARLPGHAALSQCIAAVRVSQAPGTQSQSTPRALVLPHQSQGVCIVQAAFGVRPVSTQSAEKTKLGDSRDSTTGPGPAGSIKSRKASGWSTRQGAKASAGQLRHWVTLRPWAHPSSSLSSGWGDDAHSGLQAAGKGPYGAVLPEREGRRLEQGGSFAV